MDTTIYHIFSSVSSGSGALRAETAAPVPQPVLPRREGTRGLMAPVPNGAGAKIGHWWSRHEYQRRHVPELPGHDRLPSVPYESRIPGAG